MYGTTDIPEFNFDQIGVELWEDHEKLWEWSPLAYAHKIKTPLLIKHAENDYRVPIEQAEQMYATARRAGAPVKFVRYPRDGHELSRSGEPNHRLSRMNVMIDWFDQHCMVREQKKKATTKTKRK
jgi:dipeptidyl aminopeptidase/acylaminoacyl peptidase